MSADSHNNGNQNFPGKVNRYDQTGYVYAISSLKFEFLLLFTTGIYHLCCSVSAAYRSRPRVSVFLTLKFLDDLLFAQHVAKVGVR